MRKRIAVIATVLALITVMSGMFLAGCGRSSGLIPLNLYVPTSCVEGETVNCAVSIPYPVALPVVISITASAPCNLSTAAVIIPAGKVYVEFSLQVTDDQIANPNVSITLTASAPGYTDDVAPFTIVDAGS